MAFALLAEGIGIGVKTPEGPHQFSRALPALVLEPRAQRGGVGRFLGAETSVTAAVKRRTDRATAGLRYRPQAHGSLRDRHADRPAELAFHANAVLGDVGFSPPQQGADQFDELIFVDRTAP